MMLFWTFQRPVVLCYSSAVIISSSGIHVSLVWQGDKPVRKTVHSVILLQNIQSDK